MLHYQRFSSPLPTHLIKVNFYDSKTQEQGVLVADDLNKLLLGLLMYFTEKIVGYCKRSSHLMFWWF